MELMQTFKNYVKNSCGKNNAQESNLTEKQRRGIKSLKSRMKAGEDIILPTDKSGRLAIMSLKTYLKAGMKHTDKDEEITFKDIKDTQADLNGNISMLIKIFKICKTWKHTDRVREAMINNSLAVCPLYLLFKDHKNWSWAMGTPPPTRPVAAGNMGMNQHISEVVSDFIEPVVDTFEGGLEIISTEDMLARIDELNKKMENWTPFSWWE